MVQWQRKGEYGTVLHSGLTITHLRNIFEIYQAMWNFQNGRSGRTRFLHIRQNNLNTSSLDTFLQSRIGVKNITMLKVAGLNIESD